MASSRQLAHQFLEHFNARNSDDLLQIFDTNVRYNGRKDDGMQLLLEWIGRASTTMTPVRWFGHDDLTVAEVDVTWHSPRTGEKTDHAVWAIAFTFADDKIIGVSRYADVGEAITKMGLLPDDALPEAGFPMPKS